MKKTITLIVLMAALSAPAQTLGHSKAISEVNAEAQKPGTVWWYVRWFVWSAGRVL